MNMRTRTRSYISPLSYTGAIGIGLLLCLIHSALREPPELFDDTDGGMHGKYGASLESVAVAGSAASLKSAFEKLWNTEYIDNLTTPTMSSTSVLPK